MSFICMIFQFGLRKEIYMVDNMEQSLDKAQNANLATLIATILMSEARGEGMEGMQAVGNVIQNRVGHPWYDKDLKTVVTQPNAFSSAYQGKIDDVALDIANKIIRGELQDITDGATNFHSFKEGPTYIPPGWGKPEAYKFTKTIGGHHFFRGE